ncbi:MAG: rhodanese-like domain-containing protein, partial [Thermomicrobiales bacterium]
CARDGRAFITQQELGNMAKTAAQLVAEAKASIENLMPHEVAGEIASSDVLVVDIREPEERRTHGAIAGAVSAPRGMLEFYADPTSAYHKEGFDPDRRVILHCASGGRSALAVKSLQDLGYTNIAHMDKGFNGWKEQGLPVEDGK